MKLQNKRRWAFPVPLHLSNDDYSAEACELRLHLYQSAFHRTQGRGFRLGKTTGSKRKNPRRGWASEATRIATIAVIAMHGERNEV